MIAEQPWSPTRVEGRRQGALMASRVAAAAVVAALLLAAAYTVPGLLRGGELRVTVPLGWARAKGYVAGFVQVVATSPKGYAVKTEYIDLGSTKTIDIDLPVKQAWTQSSLKPGSGELAVVHVNLYLYDREGHLCLSAATLDTLNYLCSRISDPDKAYQEALRHPDAVLHAGHITFTRDMFTPCVDLSKPLQALLGERLEKALTAAKPRPAPARGGLPPGTRLVLVYPGLYNARDKPPKSWLERITPQSYAKPVWRIFAYHYSYALLVPGYYSLSEALRGAAYWYRLVEGTRKAPNGNAVYGLVPMNLLINALYAFSVPLHWRNHYAPGTVLKHFNKAPIVLLNTTCPTCPYYSYDRMKVQAVFSSAKRVSVDYGLSILGVIVWPHSSTDISLVNEGATATLKPGNDIEAIYAPMDDVYEADGMLVVLYFTKVRYNGDDYWFIVPVFSPIIMHYYRFDYTRLAGENVPPGDEIYSALNYMTHQYDVATGAIITPANLTVSKLCVYDSFSKYITLDSFSATAEWSNSLAAFFAYTGNYLLWTLAASILGPEYGVLVSVASYLVSVTYMDSHTAAQAFKLELQSGHTGHMVGITVEKFTQRYMTSNDAPDGIYPTLVVYKVYGRDYGYSSGCG